MITSYVMQHFKLILVSIFVIRCWCGAEADYWDWDWDNVTDTRRGGYRVPQFQLIMSPSPKKFAHFRMESVWAYFNKWSLYYDVKFMMEMIHIDTENKHAIAKKYVDYYKETDGLELGLIGAHIRRHFKHMINIYKKYTASDVMQYGEYDGEYKDYFYFNPKSFYNDLTNFAKGLTMVVTDYVSIETMHTRFLVAVERYKTGIRKRRSRKAEFRKTNTFAPVRRFLNKDDAFTIDYFGHKLYKRKPKNQRTAKTNPTLGKGRDDLFQFADQPVTDVAALRRKWLAKFRPKPKASTTKKAPVQWPPRPGSDAALKRGLRQKQSDKVRGGFEPKREGINVDLSGLF